MRCLKAERDRRGGRRPDLRDLRPWAVAVMALHTGLRVIELSRLQWRDILQDSRQHHAGIWRLCVRRGKGGKRRYVDLGQPTLDLLDLWRAVLVKHHISVSDRTPIYPSQRRRAGPRKHLSTRSLQYDIERAYDLCGISGHSIHDLRHTYASYLYLGCRDLAVVQRQLGHSDLRTTMRYVHTIAKVIFDVLGRLYD